eukprot:c49923_g1_i1 orf=1-387(+)
MDEVQVEARLFRTVSCSMVGDLYTSYGVDSRKMGLLGHELQRPPGRASFRSCCKEEGKVVNIIWIARNSAESGIVAVVPSDVNPVIQCKAMLAVIPLRTRSTLSFQTDLSHLVHLVATVVIFFAVGSG